MFHRGSLTLRVVLCVVGALAPAAASADSPQSCESLPKLRLPNTTITSAAVVPAGALVPPSGLGATPAGPITEDQLDSADCLTAKQVEIVKSIYAGPRDSSGKSLFPGVEPGFERSWDRFITGTKAGNSHNFDLAVPFAKYFLLGVSDWNYQAWNFDRDLELADRKLAKALNATDPDLGAFRAHGGKLLLYHGWQDSGIPPRNTINYFKSVVSTVHHDPADASDDETAAFLRDAKETGNFARLFMVPGVEHCDRLGGPGPDRSNFFQALEAWVEHGKPPETILASHVTAGKIDRARPLCPYPMTAQYSDHGSI